MCVRNIIYIDECVGSAASSSKQEPAAVKELLLNGPSGNKLITSLPPHHQKTPQIINLKAQKYHTLFFLLASNFNFSSDIWLMFSCSLAFK